MIYVKSEQRAFLESYYGKTLEEIADWYPETVTVQNVLDILVQTEEYDVLDDIRYYSQNHKPALEDQKHLLGFFSFIQVAEVIAKRVLFAAYQYTDDNNEEIISYHKKTHTKTAYSRDYFEEYLNELDGDKRFITKNEFEDFLDSAIKRRNIRSLIEAPFSVDSLFYCLIHNAKQYGIEQDEITRKYLTKGNQPWDKTGTANDFIKYRQFLVCSSSNKVLNESSILLFFFKKAIEVDKNKIQDIGLNDEKEEELDTTSNKIGETA